MVTFLDSPIYCGSCGYDVRGLSTSICPECGRDLYEVGVRIPSRRGWLRRCFEVAYPVIAGLAPLLVFGYLASYLCPILVETDLDGSATYGRLGAYEEGIEIEYQARGRQLHWHWPIGDGRSHRRITEVDIRFLRTGPGTEPPNAGPINLLAVSPDAITFRGIQGD